MNNENITETVMVQYEKIRKSSVVNMLDISGVEHHADIFGFFELADVAGSRSDYMDLIGNFAHYMQKYEVSQDE